MKLQIKQIPLPSGASHPKPPNEVLPKHEFSMGFIAQKGAGKTTTLMNILHFYKGYFHTIIIFSPTIDNDEKWEWVRYSIHHSKNISHTHHRIIINHSSIDQETEFVG